MKPFGSGIKIPEGTYERHIKKIRNRIRAAQRTRIYKRKEKIKRIFNEG